MIIDCELVNVTKGVGKFAVSPPITAYSFNVSENKLFWCAITVGKDSRATLLRNGRQSILEIKYRKAIIGANLVVGTSLSNTYFVKSNVYKTLDPTEKGGVSYYIGNMIAKLLASEIYDIDWLMHLDVYGTGYGLGFNSRGKRPDFFGIDKNKKYHIVESKGTINGFNEKMRSNAIVQAKSGVTVPGGFLSRNATQAYFRGDVLKAYIEDPDEEDIELIITPDLNKVIQCYYWDIFNCVSEGEDSNEFRVFRDDDGVTIGLKKEIYELYAQGNFSTIYEFYRNSTYSELRPKYENAYIGNDGVLVEISSESTYLRGE